MPIISFSDIAREVIGNPLTNGDALEITKTEREKYYKHFISMKEEAGQDWSFKQVIEKFKLVMAYDILIDSFEKFLVHEK